MLADEGNVISHFRFHIDLSGRLLKLLAQTLSRDFGFHNNVVRRKFYFKTFDLIEVLITTQTLASDNV